MDKQLRILFAQDSEEEVLALLEELRHGGYGVSWERVYSRSLTKSALSRREWDLVIASYEMSRLSSLDILEILREKGLATPLIIVSEYLEEESVVHAIKSGAQDFVLRSNLTRLLSVIENCLQHTNNKPLRSSSDHSLDISDERSSSSDHSLDISDERLMLVLEENNTGLWDWDIQTGKVHFTPPWGSMFGYEAEELEPDIRSWHRLVHPDDIAEVQRVLEEHLEGQSVYYETEHRIQSKQGEWIWIQDRGRVVEKDDEGRPLRLIGTYMDISAKKRAESSVYLKRMEFETIFRAIPDAVVFASSSQEIIMVNPAFNILFGYKPDEVHGKKSALLYAEKEVFEELNKYYSNADADEKLDLREVRYKKKNGEVFTCEMVRTPVNDARGTAIGFVEIIRDISRRQKTERSSQKGEKQFRYLLEAAPQAILITDEEGKISLVNAMAEKLYGYNRNALIGQPVEMLIPERLQDKHIRHRSDYMRKPRSRKMGENLNLYSVNKEGREFPVEVSLSYIKIEGKIYVMSFISKVSERRKIDEAREESETSYLRLFEEDLTGNFVMTPDGKLLTCNLTFARIFGFTSTEEAKKTNFFSLHANPQFKSSFLELLNKKKRLEFHEIELRHQEGRTIYIVENVIGMFDKKGKLEKIRGYLFDDTRRREIESQFMQAQKMESLGTLAGSIAHDFNNLLSVISANSEILLLKMNSEDPLRKAAEQIKQTSRQAAILTNQILTFSRKQVVQPRVINLNDVVENVSKILLRLIGKDIEMKTVLNPGLGKVKIDPVQIEQIIINLAVNARDAMTGGGKLTIGTNNIVLSEESAKMHLDARPGPYVLLAVSDTGTGMDPKTRQRIFEPFFTTKKKGKGTGLGLATVYGIVKQNKGFIDIYSELGKGSIFKIYMPIQSEE